MAGSFNRKAIEEFGRVHRNMPLASSNKYYDEREGELITYIDLQIVRKWALPYFLRIKAQELSVLDIGAGKGRMTRHFAEFADRCVALEPFADFYRVLKTVCGPYENVETYDLTLSEYIAREKGKFDFIYVSGVTPQLDDEEVEVFFRDAMRTLKPFGLICVRDLGYPLKTEYTPSQIHRTREHVVGVAAQAGLECIRWRRAYPPFIFDKLHSLWPNSLTMGLRNTAFNRIFFPLWELLAQLNLPRGRRRCFFVYLFCQVASARKVQIIG